MDVKLVDRGDTGELILNGKIDSKNAGEVEELFLSVTDRFDNITLNMKDLSYISSAGLRVLKKVYIQIHNKGGEVKATNVNEYVNEVFEMTGFARILNIS